MGVHKHIFICVAIDISYYIYMCLYPCIGARDGYEPGWVK